MAGDIPTLALPGFDRLNNAVESCFAYLGPPDFEALDFEGDSDVSSFSVREVPHKRTSRVGTRHVGNPEAVEQMLFAAAAEASIRDFMSGGASTSTGSSGHNISGHTGLTAPTEFYYADSDVVPDSEPEGDLLEPIVQTGWMAPAKGKGKNKGQWKAEYARVVSVQFNPAARLYAVDIDPPDRCCAHVHSGRALQARLLAGMPRYDYIDPTVEHLRGRLLRCGVSLSCHTAS